MSDYISRADAIEAVAEEWLSEASAESPYVNDDDIGAYRTLAENLFKDVPSADAYTEQQVRDAFNSGYSCGMEQTKEAQSADAVQGEWINREYCQVDEDAYEVATCSNCKSEITIEYPYDNYCPNCGAIMLKESEK